MPRPALLIFGVDGFGRQAADIALHQCCYQLAACVTAGERIGAAGAGGLIQYAQEQLAPLRARGVTHALVAMECNRTRVEVAAALIELGFELATVIHPTAAIARSAVIGPHVLIGPRATICVHARIESHAVISTSSIVEHDNVVAQGAWLAPAVRLAGGVNIGAGARIGIGACVIPGCNIGAWSEVAPGAVVIQDVAAHSRVEGVPARIAPQPRALGASRFVSAEQDHSIVTRLPEPVANEH